jgi:hypothetical protein
LIPSSSGSRAGAAPQTRKFRCTLSVRPITPICGRRLHPRCRVPKWPALAFLRGGDRRLTVESCFPPDALRCRSLNADAEIWYSVRGCPGKFRSAFATSFSTFLRDAARDASKPESRFSAMRGTALADADKEFPITSNAFTTQSSAGWHWSLTHRSSVL